MQFGIAADADISVADGALAAKPIAAGSDAARHVTGQIFGVRNNEIYLFSQPRPIRTAHTADGWTPETILDRVPLAVGAPDHLPGGQFAAALENTEREEPPGSNAESRDSQ